MDFQVQFLSFYLVTVDGKGEQADKRCKHFQTLTEEEYEDSSLKDFLNGEFTKIMKRKAERHPKTEDVPTKIGYFIVEEGHDLSSNPNYNLFSKARRAESKESFMEESQKFAKAYIETSAVRGGVFIVARSKLRKYFDDSFIFILKCDFEPKVAAISDESTLIRNVEMAITTKGMKSIVYPFMPEEGMIEDRELKINQASHSRYFEDFLKYVEFRESMPEIVKTQVIEMVRHQMEDMYEPESDERNELENSMEIWAASEKRELQERFEPEQVMEAAAQIMEHAPELDLKMKLDHVSVKGLLSDFGESIHLAKAEGKYILMIESDSVVFEKGFSPVEFVKPVEVETVMERIRDRK
ncbi:DUF3900 domain-containing protein [Bacillus massilinigeriensis]|uniref:DUF3900 domain-containing protein n=1 Tax=Bacillus mediterraneensis TaxID=1805474 RepID=UPI0008F7EE6C|nr:DUF3900 domain-containing protein [Bacillus mediterraneensis]